MVHHEQYPADHHGRTRTETPRMGAFGSGLWMSRSRGVVISIFVLLPLLVLVPPLAGATTIYVPSDGNQTIQQAVDNAREGDEIIVQAAYMEQVTGENIDITVPYLTIRSENNAVVVRAANPYDHVFHVRANYTTITGFTVTGTDASDTELSAGSFLIRCTTAISRTIRLPTTFTAFTSMRVPRMRSPAMW